MVRTVIDKYDKYSPLSWLLFFFVAFGCSSEPEVCVGALGSQDSCASGCWAVNGRRVDVTNECVEAWEDIRCIEEEFPLNNGSQDCYVRKVDGAIFLTANAFSTAYLDDWTSCTDEAREQFQHFIPCVQE